MYALVRISDRVVLSYGNAPVDPVPPAGVQLVSLDQATAQAILAALSSPSGGVTLGVDLKTVTALPVPSPDPVLAAGRQQRISDAVVILNNAAVTVDQASRDAMARTLGVKPLTIPLIQKAVAGDITPVGW